MRHFQTQQIMVNIKILVWYILILPFILHSVEAWTVYNHHIKYLERFHQKCLHQILRVVQATPKTSMVVLGRAGISLIHITLVPNQLRWTSHLKLIENECIPKQSFS